MTAPETIGELYDSLAPEGITYRRAFGETWKITRVAVPEPVPADVDDVWHVRLEDTTWCNRCGQHCQPECPCDCCDGQVADEVTP